ncbi:DUF6985 domain-containing protein [Aliikangiella maris]|uniref:DUF6985 domain-containing protein n=2 Tax=Aliikangiella maris TaxID=3162458 RepID=A0ABV2BZ54_9GAMM
MVVNDNVLGKLSYDSYWKRGYSIDFFNDSGSVELIIQTFDDDEITDNQRDTFTQFEANKDKIFRDVEEALFEYYNESFRDTGLMKEAADLKNVINLRKVKIMSTDDGEDRELGFIFDASFDPELGVGVLVTNETEIEVDVQDIVLG